MSSFGRFGKNQDHAVGEFSICIKVRFSQPSARATLVAFPLSNILSSVAGVNLGDVLSSTLFVDTLGQGYTFLGRLFDLSFICSQATPCVEVSVMANREKGLWSISCAPKSSREARLKPYEEHERRHAPEEGVSARRGGTVRL